MHLISLILLGVIVQLNAGQWTPTFQSRNWNSYSPYSASQGRQPGSSRRTPWRTQSNQRNRCPSSSRRVGKRATGLQVEYKIGRCSCKGIEIKRGSKCGPRELNLNCRKPSGSVRCTYKGNPHGCHAYNQGRQETFYQQALKSVGSIICDLPVNKMICPRGKIITDLCGELGEGKDFVLLEI